MRTYFTFLTSLDYINMKSYTHISAHTQKYKQSAILRSQTQVQHYSHWNACLLERSSIRSLIKTPCKDINFFVFTCTHTPT